MIFSHPLSSKKTKWFTILELLIGLFIISLAVLAVIKMIDAANGHIKKIKQETIAINLAREGMEAMYNRRNTNRLRHPSEKDKYWLCIDNNCNSWFQNDGDYYILSTVDSNSFENDASSDSIRNSSFLLQDDAFIGQKPMGSFYRAIIPIWLYQKDINITWWVPINCNNWLSAYGKVDFDGNDIWNSSCSDNAPKEFRFCTRVEYEGEGNGNVELCWSLTNYKE